MELFKLLYPVKPYTVTQKFGENKNSFYKELGMKGHNGIDILTYDGQPVYASHDGEVTFTGEDGAGGLGVVIRTNEEFLDLNGEPCYFKTIYWHLKKESIKVKATDKVKAGQLIALSDNTGKSTGTHLHWGAKKVQKGEQDWQWFNLEQDNGYLGATDPQPYCTGGYAVDIQIDLINKLLGLYSSLLELLKVKNK